VRRAIEFRRPSRIPFSTTVPWGGDFFDPYILGLLISRNAPEKPAVGTRYYDEWGVGFQVTGREWDHPFDCPLQDLRRLDAYRFPSVSAERDYRVALPYLPRACDNGKYILGRDPIIMIERLRWLMGFEALMTAAYDYPAELVAVIDRLTEMTIEAVEFWASLGLVDAFVTPQDWGLQTSLQMRPAMFRQHFKSHYRRVAEACHRHGMRFIWHSCGWILDIIPDIIEVGTDVLQLDQPQLLGHRRLAEAFGGQITFWNSVDIVWLAQPDVERSAAEVEAEVENMARPFDRFGGGFMFRQYSAPWSLNIPDMSLQAATAAFLRYRPHATRGQP
jgi:hypothetical protein